MTEGDSESITRSQWLRKKFPAPKGREQCYVCGGWHFLTHWHHAPTISFMAQSNIPLIKFFEFDWPMFPLCPNHHAAVHLLARGGLDGRRIATLKNLAEDELGRVDEIFEVEVNAWRELRGKRNRKTAIR